MASILLRIAFKITFAAGGTDTLLLPESSTSWKKSLDHYFFNVSFPISFRWPGKPMCISYQDLGAGWILKKKKEWVSEKSYFNPRRNGAQFTSSKIGITWLRRKLKGISQNEHSLAPHSISRLSDSDKSSSRKCHDTMSGLNYGKFRPLISAYDMATHFLLPTRWLVFSQSVMADRHLI